MTAVERQKKRAQYEVFKILMKNQSNKAARRKIARYFKRVFKKQIRMDSREERHAKF